MLIIELLSFKACLTNLRLCTNYRVRVRDNSDETLVDEFKKTQYFTSEEKKFLEKYRKPTNAPYSHTAYTNDEDDFSSAEDIEPMPDYSKMTVATLKELCREKNLAVSGKKGDLIQRLIKAYGEFLQLAQIAASKKRLEWKEAPRKTIARTVNPNNVYSNTLPQLDLTQTRKTSIHDDPKVASYLESLVKEYLTASGGVASSRDIGRYLSANSDSCKVYKSALAELKVRLLFLTFYMPYSTLLDGFLIINSSSRCLFKGNVWFTPDISPFTEDISCRQYNPQKSGCN